MSPTHQQDVNQISGNLKAKTQYPEDQENDKNSPKHRFRPQVRHSARARMPRHPTSRSCAGRSRPGGHPRSAVLALSRNHTLSAHYLLELGDGHNLLDLQYLDHRRGDTTWNFEPNDIVLEHLLSQ